jgi:hypothetical protein
MRFTKIKKTKEGKIFLEYQEQNPNGQYDNYSFECTEAALPEFTQALSALAPDMLELCELPEDRLSRITVKAVSLAYSGDKEVMGACISGCMELLLSNCPLNLNTPFKPSGSYNDNPPADDQILSGVTVSRIEKLCDEARRYLRGERAQGNLFKAWEEKKEEF